MWEPDGSVNGAQRAVRVVRLPRDERATGIAGNAGTAEVIAVQVRDARARPHRDALAVKVVVLGDRACLRHLKPVADVVRRRAAHHARDARAVGVVGVGSFSTCMRLIRFSREKYHAARCSCILQIFLESF